MPVATVKPGPVDASVLRRRLAAVRGRLRRVHLVRGLGWTVVALLLPLLVASLLDFRWLLPALVRALFLVGALIGGGLLLLNYLIRPLTAKADDLSLALKIEESYPVLNDCLASTIEFLDRGADAPAGESEAMRRLALRQTLQKAASCDFFRIIDARGVRLAGLTGVAALVAVVVLGVFYPAQAATAFARLADPFGRHDWPTQTQLTLEPPPRRLALNEGLEIKGTVHGVIPAEARLFLRPEGFPVREQVIKIAQQSAGEGLILVRLPASEIPRSFRFHVQAGDAVSDVFEVAVLPPPALAFLDGKPSPQIRLDYPAYTDLPSPRYLPPGIGHVEAIAGTRITLRGAADRPLRRVWIEPWSEPRFEQRIPMHLLPLTAPPGGSSLEAVLSRVVGPLLQQPVEGVLGDDAKRFEATFRPWLAGDYLLHLEDDTGLRGSRSFELRLRPDPAPLVVLERPSAGRNLLLALPAASIPIEVLIEDSTFAIRSAFLRYRTHRDEPPRTMLLYSEGLARREIGQAAGPAVAVAPPHFRPTRLEVEHLLSLKRITHPDGSPLKGGDSVFLEGCADDFDTVNPHKEAGTSGVVEIRIVDRNRLDLALNEEQARIHQELLRQREKQRDLLRTVRDLKTKVEKGQKLTPEEQRDLTEVERQQGAIQERIGTPRQGMRADVAKLLETLDQNGLQKSAAQERLSDIEKELDRIATNELPKVQAALTEARKAQERAENPMNRRDAGDKLRREAQGKLDRADALKRNDPGALEKAAEKLQQQAREAEAKGSLDRSQDLQTEAAQLRQQARDLQKNPVNPDAKATKEEIARLEQQARELNEAADRLEGQPMLTREEATQKNLGDARQSQEEIERTLTDLLARLEPWSSDRELKGEANKLLQEQKDLIQKAQDLDRQGLEGQHPDRLTSGQKIDLRNLAEEQQRLERRTSELVEKIKNVAEERGKKDPERAAELRQAAEQAQKDNIAGKMQDARREIDANHLSRARDQQRAAAAALEKALKNLDERREDKFDRLAKKLRETEQQLEKLQDDLERLKKQRQAAEKIADPGQREQELQRLRQEQEQLRAKGQEVARELARLRNQGGARGLENAQRNLEEAVKQLQRREDEQAANEALDRIEEARQEVQESREQTQEELAREQLIRVMDVLKNLKERQDGLTAEAKRIQERLRQEPTARSLRTSLSRLADAQKGLANETVAVSSRDLNNAPVFARMVQRASEAMVQAGERAVELARLNAQKLPPLPDADLGRWQDLAARRLEQVLKAVKEEVDAPQLSAPAEGGGEGPAPGDHLPPLAQLKLLKVLEGDVRQQLLDFKREHPDLTRLDEKGLARLQSLLRQRQDVRELFDDLNRPGDEPAPPAAQPEPEAKPEGARP